jgi:two-component system, LytTR family, sensor kinase
VNRRHAGGWIDDLMGIEAPNVMAVTLSSGELVKPGSLPIVRSEGDTRWLRAMWRLYVVFGLLFGAYLGINAMLGEMPDSHFEPWRPFVREYSSVLIIFLLIPLVIRLEDRFRLDARPRTLVILVHSAGALLFALIHVVVAYSLRIVVYDLAGETYFIGNVFLTFIYELQKDVITYVVVLLISFAVREFRVRRASELRAVRLTAELGEARLRHLTAQVDPHFLFNALNAISNRMREDLDAADRMITQLADLLRAAYDTDQHLLVPLGSELQWLRGYAGMMAERFRGQLNFELDIEPSLESLEVPRLLLQPLVENALRHGLAEGRGSLSVQVRRNGHRVRYIIADDGVGLPPTPLRRGTGLSNVSRRLELMFPGDHEFSLASRSPRGTLVTVEFPVCR